MKILGIGAATLLLTVTAVMAQDGEPIDLDRASYAVGVSVGMGFAEQSIDLVLEHFQRGVTDGLNGTSEMEDEELRTMIAALQAEIQKRRADPLTVQGEANVASSARFLEENGAREGVMTLDSGVQYEVLESGDE